MLTEFKISDSHQKHIKIEAIEAIVLISFLLIIVPPIIYMNYWYFAILIGITLVPVWVKYRWQNYKKEMLNIKKHYMIVYDNFMQFNYGKSKYEIDISQIKKLNINLRKGKISSITPYVTIPVALEVKLQEIISLFKNSSNVETLKQLKQLKQHENGIFI